jgi:hypothetical protein
MVTRTCNIRETTIAPMRNQFEKRFETAECLSDLQFRTLNSSKRTMHENAAVLAYVSSGRK